MYTSFMQYITTTELRTKSKELVNSLSRGESVILIHRSRVVGQIKPKTPEPKVFNTERFVEITKKLNLPELSHKERERRYRKHLMDKYGKNITKP